MKLGRAKGGVSPDYVLTYAGPVERLKGQKFTVRLCKPGYNGCVAYFNEGQDPHYGEGWHRLPVEHFHGWAYETIEHTAVRTAAVREINKGVVDFHPSAYRGCGAVRRAKLRKALKNIKRFVQTATILHRRSGGKLLDFPLA